MRRRLLLIAYRLDPDFSMESRLAWKRAVSAAADFDVTVACAVVADDRPQQLPDGIEVLHLPHDVVEGAYTRLPGGFQFANARWQRRLANAAAAMHRKRPFDLVHHVSYCGYRQPSECWRLDAPFVWGPIGGTHNFPRQFLAAIDPVGAIREIVRNAANSLQLRTSSRVRRAAQGSACVLAASHQAARELRRAGLPVGRIMLETGIDDIADPRPRRDASQPLRILWAGRACSWKGLPILLHALAQMPRDGAVQLRVMAAGPRLQKWKSLATRLGVDSLIDWVGWPGYEARLPHYQWADVFAFTSLRDTSGTGLLESLAAGVPIVGFDHQGAADVMTEACAVKIPTSTPGEAILAFRLALADLAADVDRLASLSRGAIARASDFSWTAQGACLRGLYAELLAPTAQPRESAQSIRSPSYQAIPPTAAAVGG